jgi:Glycosyl transferase family 2
MGPGERCLPPAPPGALAPGPASSFSAIVAAYEVANVIGEALDSLRRQTVARLEVIVSNDGSTDDLEGALAPCQREIVPLHQENGGDAAAKKAAARETAGDFVLILDADDVYLPERIAALTELGHAPDLDILTTDGLLVAGGRPVRRVYDRSWRFEVGERRPLPVAPVTARRLVMGRRRRASRPPKPRHISTREKWGHTHRGIGGIAVEAWRQASLPRVALSERTTNHNKLDGVRFGGWRRTHGSTRWAAWPIERLGDGCHAVFALNGRSEGEVPIGVISAATVALSVALLVAPVKPRCRNSLPLPSRATRSAALPHPATPGRRGFCDGVVAKRATFLPSDRKADAGGRSLGFRPVKSFTMPDRRKLWIWWKGA